MSVTKGAEIGSVVPGLGTAIGAGIGSLFGGGSSYTPPPNQDQTKHDYIYAQFNSMFGRDPTTSEYDMLLPSYNSQGTDWGRTGEQNVLYGNAALASYYQSQQNTPEALAAKQQSDALAAYQKGQSGYDATTNQAFQSATGQAATSDELSHFGSLLASGQIDAYGLSQLVGQTQAAQQYQTQQYQNTLSQNLQATQGDYFKNYINPSILSQTAAAGRDPNSSGVQQAEVQAGKQQNYDLQNYLANFGASQYGQSAQNQQGVYQQYLNQQYNLQNAGISQQLGQQNYMQNQNTNFSNYQLQQNAYNHYLNNYGNRGNGATGAIGGATSGAALGTSILPGWGTAIGGVAGGIAGYFGSKGGF